MYVKAEQSSIKAKTSALSCQWALANVEDVALSIHQLTYNLQRCATITIPPSRCELSSTPKVMHQFVGLNYFLRSSPHHHGHLLSHMAMLG
jgi:hypothetical protein